ncbi:LLM class F420-dependent oxidoreductase [Amycolatopsis cihanbeyliensis]|uniref:Putative F420-dependent oxidoreductase n=1 Tax=Amycolatopsis cihanbeyliensis TaxID=1128664 RepID=A0A542DKP8_AMYCI|nr:LLM class F420-dependent oxidoreductase [Amycolatopsis cihanbeyliensis]TQJ03604.1 putative F420-dependent oxidoreductase [Amycolatopsis cihanbeyliensis]
MGIELGKIGVWRAGAVDPEFAEEAERLGYGTIWIGGSPPADLAAVDGLLEATRKIAVATGIVNMWTAGAAEVAASYHRIAVDHANRFLLGVGVGHPEMQDAYTSPYQKILGYLDELDAVGVPAGSVVLAALGPKVLRVAGERTAGAHPYLTTPEHTRQARETLGSGPLLAPEQKVVLDTDPERARAIARPVVGAYLGLRNYTNSLLRFGYTELDFYNGGSDRLVDALALHGDAATIARGITAHLEAGADHVAVQVLTADGADPRPAYRELAAALF